MIHAMVTSFSQVHNALGAVQIEGMEYLASILYNAREPHEMLHIHMKGNRRETPRCKCRTDQPPKLFCSLALYNATPKDLDREVT
jgi:hypothetical protein